MSQRVATLERRSDRPTPGAVRQRRAVTDRAAEAAPIVHDVLRSPGRPIDAETRGLMESRFGHDFSRVRVHSGARAAEPVHKRTAGKNKLSDSRLSLDALPGTPVLFSPRTPPSLPLTTPAWTERGTIHLGVHSLFMSADRRQEVIRHETVHSLQQRMAPPLETPGARARAEAAASSVERHPGQSLALADLFAPVPSLLAYPPQTYSPWDTVWIGHPGIVGEISVSGVTVRIFMEYDKLGILKRNKKGYLEKTGYVAYECGKHNLPAIRKAVARMKKVASVTATFNKRIFSANSPQRVALVVVHGGSSSNAYRWAHGKGLIVLAEDDFNKGRFADTLAHEASHAIFEFHSVRGHKNIKKRVPDPLALRVADLFVRLGKTPGVPVPKQSFKKQKPRTSATAKQSTRAVGLVMVMDTLWAAGPGGHPWDSADEFFASAYAGFVQEPRLFGQILDHYQKAYPELKPLVAELLQLLGTVGSPKSQKGLTAPSPAKAAQAELAGISAPVDFSSKSGRLGWLIDPTQMPSPQTIHCASKTKTKTDDRTIEEILDEEFGDEKDKPIEEILEGVPSE